MRILYDIKFTSKSSVGLALLLDATTTGNVSSSPNKESALADWGRSVDAEGAVALVWLDAPSSRSSNRDADWAAAEAGAFAGAACGVLYMPTNIKYQLQVVQLIKLFALQTIHILLQMHTHNNNTCGLGDAGGGSSSSSKRLESLLGITDLGLSAAAATEALEDDANNRSSSESEMLSD
jgi:hypothetical protein